VFARAYTKASREAKNGVGLNKYKYNGKELQDELGLNVYDYGFRDYDPALGRWNVIDPLSEKRIGWSPYTYCINNPVLRVDPNGLTDFTFDKKTGAVKQVGKTNDDPDRIVKTNKKGEVKYKKNGEAKAAISGIEKGILKDGHNFKENGEVISTGGKGQPSVEGVEKFAVKLSEYVGTEIAGAYFSKGNTDSITHMTIGSYGDNTYTSSGSFGNRALEKISSDLKELNSFQYRAVFHTHPYEQKRAQPSQADKDARDSDLRIHPALQFFILTYPENKGDNSIEKINYIKY
jgi:RHS repeat-associated protein